MPKLVSHTTNTHEQGLAPQEVSLNSINLITIFQAKILALGNFYPEHAHAEFLDNNNLIWDPLDDYPFHEDIHYGAIISYDQDFYVFGGRSVKTLITTIAKISPTTRQWSQGKIT